MTGLIDQKIEAKNVRYLPDRFLISEIFFRICVKGRRAVAD